MVDVKKDGKRTGGLGLTTPDQVKQLAKGLESLPPFNFSARAGGGTKVYIHSHKWRKSYEERKTANTRRRKSKALV